MTGSERRTEIIEQIEKSRTPVSGKRLAESYGVSRQVIVQDIALLRAAGYDVIATNRGYILNMPSKVTKVFKVCHSDERLEEELCAVVDLGGCVENVMVNHKVYGKLEANLQINTRRKAAEFAEEIRSGKSSPLKNITADYHYHKISADSEETLCLIEKALSELGILVKEDRNKGL